MNNGKWWTDPKTGVERFYRIELHKLDIQFGTDLLRFNMEGSSLIHFQNSDFPEKLIATVSSKFLLFSSMKQRNGDALDYLSYLHKNQLAAEFSIDIAATAIMGDDDSVLFLYSDINPIKLYDVESMTSIKLGTEKAEKVVDLFRAAKVHGCQYSFTGNENEITARVVKILEESDPRKPVPLFEEARVAGIKEIGENQVKVRRAKLIQENIDACL